MAGCCKSGAKTAKKAKDLSPKKLEPRKTAAVKGGTGDNDDSVDLEVQRRRRR